MTEKLTAQDVVLSLDGYEEIAIEKAFGTDLEALPAQKSMRALAFVIFRRDLLAGGAQVSAKTDLDAKDSALRATQKQVMEMFGVDVDELFADDPETEQGKGDSLSADGPSA